MSRALAFWIVCGTVMFALWLVTLYFGVHRRNWAFGVWTTSGVAVQLVFAALYVLKARLWMERLSEFDLYFGVAAALAAIVEALIRARQAGSCDSVTYTIIFGLGGILAVNLAQGLLARHAVVTSTEFCTWFRNVGFFAPALWMLLSFSNVNFNSLLSGVRDSGLGVRAEQVAAMARTMLG